MAELITLSGAIPGLLRRCSPVWMTRELGPKPARVCEYGTVISIRPALSVGTHIGWHMARPRDLELDLTDATGRAHAAWWLAGAVGASHATRDEMGGVELIIDGRGDGCWGAPLCRFIPEGTVPALANIDPNDSRKIPDGSRWVDAMALKLVCDHMAAKDST